MSFTSLFYHVVFSTKDRRPSLGRESLTRTCQYIGGIARELKGLLLIGDGMPDHVHLATEIPPTARISDFIGKLKSNSSGWIHETFPDLRDFGWQDGYSAFTVSPSVLPRVKEYIRTQEEHHRNLTFQEELVALLKKHGVEYDERYIWA
jgi:REP element-mobilizing transposase RayT